jgi:hypothetical protein
LAFFLSFLHFFDCLVGPAAVLVEEPESAVECEAPAGTPDIPSTSMQANNKMRSRLDMSFSFE